MNGTHAGKRLPAFTLIEMLVVMVIIGLLVALLLPALRMARERARQASCKNQLHQFAVAVEVYRSNFSEFDPPWLSSMYPVYVPSAEVFICPSDPTRGEEGGRPEWFSDAGYGASQYSETDDTDDCAARPEIKAMRNPEIHRCSYLYEFCAAKCSWWSDNATDASGYVWADFDHDGFVSWREAKRTEQRGLEFKDGKIEVNEDRIYGGHVPMVRCFWHARRGKSLHKEIVLNLACENKNIYESPVFGEGWQQMADK